MKTCPQCGTAYSDETLRFCLSDGAALVSAAEEPTLVSGTGRTNTNIAPPTSPAFHPPEQPGKGSSRTLVIAIIGLVVTGLLGIALIGGAGMIYLISLQKEANQPSEPQRQAGPVPPSRTDTPDTDKAKLEKELADLNEKLKDRPQIPDTADPFPPDEGITVFKSATVNSPADGFLALRNLPSSEAGDRIAKIPDGEKVQILACNPTAETIGGRSGKWCLVTWQETAGWVFDAWLKY